MATESNDTYSLNNSMSSWFPFLLMILGLAWICWFSCPFPWPWGMMPLNEACKILYKELRSDPRAKKYFDSLIAREIHSGGEEEELNLFGMHFEHVIDIYGKRTAFTNWEKISKKEFKMGEIKGGALALYRFGNYGTQDPEFIDLAIKRNKLRKAINEIMSYIKDQF